MTSRGMSVGTLMTQLTEVMGPNRTVAPMIVPPDGGWGWVIVMVGLLGACFVDGCVYCFYLFREPMSIELHALESDISYLSSLNVGFYFVGVFACSFGNHWGFRMTMILGAIVTSLSYASGYLLHNITYYYAIVGVLAGLGSGFISVGGGLPASFYFDKKRSIALGIVSCGSGLGGLLMPHIVELFMDYYGWRNTFLFEGGLLAFAIFLGTLVRPLKPVMVVVETPQDNLKAREDSIQMSTFRIPSVLPPDTISFLSIGRSVLVGEGTTHPTIAKMTDDISVINIRVSTVESNLSVMTRLYQMSQPRHLPMMPQRSASAVVLNNIHITRESLFKRRLPWYKCGCCRSKYIYLPERPLMRNDLYYTGNLQRLPEYTDTDKDLEYHMHVTRVPTYYQIVQDLTKSYTIWCCHNIFTGLGYLVDYKMFRYPSFNCLALCGFGIYLAFYLPYIFCKVHLETVNAGSSASTLVSFIGLGSLIGRMLSGLVIIAFPRFDARTVCSAMTFTSGVSIVCMVLYDNLYYKGVCLFIHGFTVGYFVPLRSLIIVDYFGLDKLTSATGVLIICIGIGSFLGPPLAEQAMQYTGSKNAPFYMCGVSLVSASLSLLPMKSFRRWEKQRTERRRRSTITSTLGT